MRRSICLSSAPSKTSPRCTALRSTCRRATTITATSGSTTNPKIALNWGIVEAVMLRANYAEAFVAPALTSRGANEFGLTGESGFSGVAGQGLPGGPPTVSTASFPSAIGIPGCPPGSTTCSLNNVTGLLLTGGSGTLQPQTGKSWSFGVDITPPAAPGLRISLTSWINELRGGITAPVPSLALGSADLSGLIQFLPDGGNAGANRSPRNRATPNGCAQCHDVLFLQLPAAQRAESRRRGPRHRRRL